MSPAIENNVYALLEGVGSCGSISVQDPTFLSWRLQTTVREGFRLLPVPTCSVASVMPNSVDGHLPGSSVHGFLQARILEWVAISYSRGSSQLRDRTRVSCSSGNAGVFFTAEPVFPLFLSVQFSHSVVSDSATP